MKHFYLKATAVAVTTSFMSAPLAADTVTDTIVQINEYRKASGRKPLKANAALNLAAQKHADELVQRGYGTTMTSGGHIGKNGSTHAKRIKRAGYKACTALENLAWGQKTPESVIEIWKNSKGHNANLLNRKIKDIGIGFAAPKTWIMLGAKPC